MSKFYKSITREQAELINKSVLFFVASADPKLAGGPDGVGPVNVSPKGGVPLHILSPNRVAYLDYPGSGNETARHAKAGGPITVMVPCFEGENAAIVRLYGKATVTKLDDSPIAGRLLEKAATEMGPAARQVIDVEVTSTMTSCGYGVPVLEFARERKKSDRGRLYKDT
ncbi:MAG TPA: pyridoxamine 5'-phosphate oxidase family protein [Candidatus Binatia bacterium]